MSITSLQNIDGKSFWKVLVGLSTSGHKPGCNQLVELTVTPELFKSKFTLLVCILKEEFPLGKKRIVSDVSRFIFFPRFTKLVASDLIT